MWGHLFIIVAHLNGNDAGIGGGLAIVKEREERWRNGRRRKALCSYNFRSLSWRPRIGINSDVSCSVVIHLDGWCYRYHELCLFLLLLATGLVFHECLLLLREHQPMPR